MVHPLAPAWEPTEALQLASMPLSSVRFGASRRFHNSGFGRPGDDWHRARGRAPGSAETRISLVPFGSVCSYSRFEGHTLLFPCDMGGFIVSDSDLHLIYPSSTPGLAMPFLPS